MKKLLVGLLTLLVVATCSPLIDKYYHRPHFSDEVVVTTAAQNAKYCYTTARGIYVYQYEADCPPPYYVDERAAGVETRFGAPEGTTQGMTLIFLSKYIDIFPRDEEPLGWWIVGYAPEGGVIFVTLRKNEWTWGSTLAHEIGHYIIHRAGYREHEEIEKKKKGIYLHGTELEAAAEQIGLDRYLLKNTRFHGLFNQVSPITRSVRPNEWKSPY